MKQVLCAVALLAAAAPAYAEGQHDLCAFSGACRTTTEAELEELRGGFLMDNAGGRLRVDIGITREVHINGNLIARSQLTIPDLGMLMKGRGAGPSVSTTVGGPGAGGSGLLVNGMPVTSVPVTLTEAGLIVQNGGGNIAPSLSEIGATSIPTIVQNTLDNQRISTLTHVNARLNSISLMNSLRLGEVMNSATARSGR
jgi:hypothetical protein